MQGARGWRRLCEGGAGGFNSGGISRSMTEVTQDDGDEIELSPYSAHREGSWWGEHDPKVSTG